MAYGRNELIDNTKYFTEAKLQENKESFLKLLRLVEIPGIEDVITFLEESGFFTTAASTRFHGNFDGALCHHSLNVCKCLSKINKDFNIGLDRDTIIITSLLHDVCKTGNLYRKVKKVFKNDGLDKYADNKWYDYMTYEYTTGDESLPLGHGEKSVMILMDFIKLTPLQKLMIRWHMGAFEEGALKNGLNDAMQYHKGVGALHLADMQASQFLEFSVNHKELPQARHERLMEETRRLSEMELNKNQNK